LALMIFCFGQDMLPNY